MSKSIVLYLHVHQPYRIKHYTIFDAGHNHEYFDASFDDRESNERVLKKVAEKSYLPTNRLLLELMDEHPEFRLSISITGTIIEQFEKWAPEVLESFQKLVSTGRVEIVGETYHHSLAFFYSRREFEHQVEMHRRKIKELFGQEPTAFRNTELAYNNDLAWWADKAGYKAILAEGWDPVLGWRSPNFVYQPNYTDDIKLLLKNYRLSDDIAFRFSETARSDKPLTAATFAHWLSEDKESEVFNLFMDYETFGEHQWAETGIFEFLSHLPQAVFDVAKKADGTTENHFITPTMALTQFRPVGLYDVPEFISWADTERDLTAWRGNAMQWNALEETYRVEKVLKDRLTEVKASGDPERQKNAAYVLEDWRKLTTSDHFYYMCTKYFADQDVHKYFNPYESPYDSYINFMNVLDNVRARLER